MKRIFCPTLGGVLFVAWALCIAIIHIKYGPSELTLPGLVVFAALGKVSLLIQPEQMEGLLQKIIRLFLTFVLTVVLSLLAIVFLDTPNRDFTLTKFMTLWTMLSAIGVIGQLLINPPGFSRKSRNCH